MVFVGVLLRGKVFLALEGGFCRNYEKTQSPHDG
jgi:hypothetical protein